VGEAGEAAAHHGDDLHDAPTVAVEHLVPEHLRHVPGTGQVGLDHRLPALRLEVARRLRVLAPGVVDEHVDLPDALLRRGGQGLHRLPLADVHLGGLHPAAGGRLDLPGRLLQGLRTARRQQQVGARLRQGQGDLPPEPGAAARHQRSAALEQVRGEGGSRGSVGHRGPF
jgi:hypothetical protein